MTAGAAGKTYSVADLAERLRGEVRGWGDLAITGINSLEAAAPDQITFISDSRYAKQWGQSRAGAAIIGANVPENVLARDRRPLILVQDAEMASITLLELFAVPEPAPDIGVHSSAVVHPTAIIGRQVRIGPHVSIDARTKVDDGVVLHAGVRLYADVKIGAGCVLHGNVVVRANCVIGRGVILHQNVSIGADGFGYRPAPDGAGLIKVPQIGNVIIEDAVEIGANSCVDRAKFGSTIIGAGTKIDNLCQIAHNCRIGRCCVIAGQSGVAGSTIIGDGVQIGGQAGIIDHLSIGSGARMGAGSLVLQDVPPGANWTGYPAGDGRAVLRQWASLRKLPELLRRLSREAPSKER